MQGYFYLALAAFETRTAYANRGGDYNVGWANASLRALSQLPQLPGKWVPRLHRLRRRQWPRGLTMLPALRDSGEVLRHLFAVSTHGIGARHAGAALAAACERSHVDS